MWQKWSTSIKNPNQSKPQAHQNQRLHLGSQQSYKKQKQKQQQQKKQPTNK